MDERRRDWVERLFSEHGAALQGFFRRRVRWPADAPDLAQEVYLRMLRVQNSDAIRNPELYLYTVANNLVKEYGTVERRRFASDDIDDLAVQEQLVQLPQFDHEADTEQRFRRLREVLMQLAPKCRAVVILHYRDGLTYREIGDRLGISTNMVKKYVMQALGHCRRRMERLR